MKLQRRSLRICPNFTGKLCLGSRQSRGRFLSSKTTFVPRSREGGRPNVIPRASLYVIRLQGNAFTRLAALHTRSDSCWKSLGAPSPPHPLPRLTAFCTPTPRGLIFSCSCHKTALNRGNSKMKIESCLLVSTGITLPRAVRKRGAF